MKKKSSAKNFVDKAFGKKMKPLKGGMSFEDALKKYGNDVTKIPGWKSRGSDGKVKPKKKAVKKK